MTAKIEPLRELRARIDELDDEILELIQRRAEVALEIGQVKKRHALTVVDRPHCPGLPGGPGPDPGGFSWTHRHL